MTGTGDRMKEPIRISVRPLVEYVHRSGSIHGGFRSNSSMLEGTRVHQLIQKSYKEHDRKEVHLRTEIPYEECMARGVSADTLVQSPGMTEPERDHFLETFQPGQERTLLGFAVLGGVFAEGVDLPGDRLNGVVVVGVGLPQIGAERDVLRDYFSEQGRNGFNYAYVYPGMNKVLQAGGRLIRTEHDEGLLVLIDDRFAKEPYASLLPEEWRSYRLTEQAGSGKEWTGDEF
ncbi:UNVERIFIED_CONTAM: hypothetical protein ABIC26_000232 [Paenibacillus sp. PvR008]